MMMSLDDGGGGEEQSETKTRTDEEEEGKSRNPSNDKEALDVAPSIDKDPPPGTKSENMKKKRASALAKEALRRGRHDRSERKKPCDDCRIIFLSFFLSFFLFHTFLDYHFPTSPLLYVQTRLWQHRPK